MYDYEITGGFSILGDHSMIHAMNKLVQELKIRYPHIDIIDREWSVNIDMNIMSYFLTLKVTAN